MHPYEEIHTVPPGGINQPSTWLLPPVVVLCEFLQLVPLKVLLCVS